jgi:uncharacterized membrane protein
MENAKSIFLSKVFWLNLLMAIFVVVQQVTGVEVASTEVEALVTVVMNIVLRFWTTVPVKGPLK